MKRFIARRGAFICVIGCILFFGLLVVYLLVLKSKTFNYSVSLASPSALQGVWMNPLSPLAYPKEVRALYITANIANSPRMDDIIRLIKKADGPYAPNAVVIDLQDSAGRLVLDDRMRLLVRQLRFLHIFPIARLVVFQNNSVAKEHPTWAVHQADGGIWRDNGGRQWLDPSNKDAWEYVADIARVAIKAGFGEINFDYFRFPSEGVMNAVYPFWSEAAGSKSEVIVSVAKYLRDTLKKEYPAARLTVDIFGYTFMRSYDLGIGQSAPALAAVFDEVCPMIYPSHYKTGNFNFTNPADHPYEVMAQTLAKGKEIFADAGQPFTNIRPWVQDFDMGAVYTTDMVREQMRAITDAGLPNQWLVWNPWNNYREAIFSDDIALTISKN